MLSPRAAIAAAFLCLCASGVHAAPLTLDAAFSRVLAHHPETLALDQADAVLAAEQDLAAQRPPLTVGGSLENALGSGGAAALGGAELTLTLASVIERADQRSARIGLADRRREATTLQREARRLDLLAEVARRYLDAVAARALAGLVRADLAQREELVVATAQRVRAGAVPSSVALAAEAARLRVAAELDRAERSEGHARAHLAALWGDPLAEFQLAAADLRALPPVPDASALLRQLEQNPTLRRFADESRVREARLQLARSAAGGEIEWQVGVRRLQATQDLALVASLSVPLGSAARAAPGIRAAEAELAAIEYEREGAGRALAATLVQALGQLDLAVASAARIDGELLPALQRAADAAAGAYRAGAAGHLEWAQLQGEIAHARRERLEASLSAHRALIELQRLTGETFAPAARTAIEEQP